MPVAKLGISFPVELVEEIDRMSKGLNKTRSEVIRDAITMMINEYKKRHAVEKAEKVYREIAEDEKQLAEDFLSICAGSAEIYKTGRKAGRK